MISLNTFPHFECYSTDLRPTTASHSVLSLGLFKSFVKQTAS